MVLQQALADPNTGYRNSFASAAGRPKGPKARRPRFRSYQDRRQAIRFTANARFKVLPGGSCGCLSECLINGPSRLGRRARSGRAGALVSDRDQHPRSLLHRRRRHRSRYHDPVQRAQPARPSRAGTGRTGQRYRAGLGPGGGQRDVPGSLRGRHPRCHRQLAYGRPGHRGRSPAGGGRRPRRPCRTRSGRGDRRRRGHGRGGPGRRPHGSPEPTGPPGRPPHPGRRPGPAARRRSRHRRAGVDGWSRNTPAPSVPTPSWSARPLTAGCPL